MVSVNDYEVLKEIPEDEENQEEAAVKVNHGKRIVGIIFEIIITLGIGMMIIVSTIQSNDSKKTADTSIEDISEEAPEVRENYEGMVRLFNDVVVNFTTYLQK